MIPFRDLRRIHEPLNEELVRAFKGVLARSEFTNGPEVAAFEAGFSAWVGTRFCVGVSSGLDAAVIALRCLGLKKGDRVVVPAMTFIATCEAVTIAGGVPVLVDVDRDGLMDLEQAELAVRGGARFLLPVHLYGQLVDPAGLRSLRDRYGVKVLEDACQAHGARLGTAAAGKIGDASAFSFYPGKNLGALGDAGALCTDDPELDRMARALREHGQTRRYHHEHEGYTARLDNLQAPFLTIKLKYLDAWNRQRIEAARYYAEKLQGLRYGRLQGGATDGSHVYHLLVLLTGKREALAAELTRQEIEFAFHYPNALGDMPCYKDEPFSKGEFPNAVLFARQAISLPIFPGITRAEIDQVVAAVRRVCG